jgi:hypothetical protein
MEVWPFGFAVLRNRYLRAMEWLQRIYRRDPKLFAHWQLVAFANGRPVGARMTGDCHVRS